MARNGIFENGVFSMGFDMDPTVLQLFDVNGGGTNNAANSTTPFGFGYAWATGSSVQKNFDVDLTTVIVGVRVFVTTLPTAAIGLILFTWQDITAAGAQVTLRALPGGKLQFYLGSGTGTPIGPSSAAGTIASSTWFYIDTKVTISATVGQVECRINGNATPVITTTATQNTKSTANALVNAIIFNQASITSFTWFDDWYMLDMTGNAPLNTYLGNIQVRGEAPNANSAVGGRNAFTPTNPTNVNFSNVANIPAILTEFNFDSNPGDYDMFRFPALPGTATSVLFLNEWALIELDSAGPRTVELNCYSGGTDAPGPAFTPSAGTFAYFNLTQVVDPNTSLAWAVAAAGSAELGCKVQT